MYFFWIQFFSLVSDYPTDRNNPEFSPSPGQNLVSDATFRSVLEIEMGSLGRATADTRSKSLVVVRILHLRMVGCFSPTAQRGGGVGSQVSTSLTSLTSLISFCLVLTNWRSMLEDVVDRKSLLPQRPTLHDAAALIGCTKQNLHNTHILSGSVRFFKCWF